ncbi:MAG: DUF1446 domain-containing protein [Bacteroidetes bacterium]|nr:DUF1446 domain-containing protein [Bacteroidota bacterium]
MKDRIFIANGQGFWGDNVDAPYQLVTGGPLDYLTLDYLAEVTMSIMQRQRIKKPETGYATDFVQVIERILPHLMKKNIKVIANAGGVNPEACRTAVVQVAKKLGVKGLKVAVVHGDNVLDRIPEFEKAGVALNSMDSGESLYDLVRNGHEVLSANVYMSSKPLVEALEKGAQIVIAGRTTDTGLAMAPMIPEFGWSWDDWNKLAAGTVAGHIIECGAQCTGGNYTKWRDVPDLWNVGYPIVEAHSDGTFYVTKHDGTGGLVTLDTVSEQLVYEMGDPKTYITGDVVADFTSIRLAQDGSNRVRVSGVTGKPSTDFFKVSASYLKGYKATGQLTVSGPDALEKARLCSDIVWRRLERAGVTFKETSTEYLGVNTCHEGIVPAPAHPNEVVLRVGVKDPDRKKVDRFGKEIAPLVTSGPPGVTGFAGGRPKPQEIVAFFPALIPKSLIELTVSVEIS